MMNFIRKLFAKPENIEGIKELARISDDGMDNILVPEGELPRARVSEEYMNTLLENKVYGIPTCEDHLGRVWPYESR